MRREANELSCPSLTHTCSFFSSLSSSTISAIPPSLSSSSSSFSASFFYHFLLNHYLFILIPPILPHPFSSSHLFPLLFDSSIHLHEVCDVQWSPSHPAVFSTITSGGCLALWNLRYEDFAYSILYCFCL